MAFKEQYKKEDFLAVLDQNPKATTVIAKQVGSVRNTATKFLEMLEAEGKAKRVEIEGGFLAWVRTEPVQADPEDLDRFRGLVEKYLAEYPESAIAKRVLDSL